MSKPQLSKSQRKRAKRRPKNEYDLAQTRIKKLRKKDKRHGNER